MDQARCGMYCAVAALRKSGVIGLAAVALLALMVSVPAIAANIVVNGSFESNGGGGEINFNTSATGWTVPGGTGSYTFLFPPGVADSGGVTGQFGNLQLWGPGNGSNNGLPASSPDGGYYVGADSDFSGHQQPIQQTVHGLTVGDSYTVSFWWAAGQQEGFNGATQSQWQVSLGSQTQSTPFANIPNHGFSGWMFESFTYTATSSDELLSFFANGSPAIPPFALLDGVTLNVNAGTPEPQTLTLMATGLAGVIGFARRYHGKKRG